MVRPLPWEGTSWDRFQIATSRERPESTRTACSPDASVSDARVRHGYATMSDAGVGIGKSHMRQDNNHLRIPARSTSHIHNISIMIMIKNKNTDGETDLQRRHGPIREEHLVRTDTHGWTHYTLYGRDMD